MKKKIINSLMSTFIGRTSSIILLAALLLVSNALALYSSFLSGIIVDKLSNKDFKNIFLMCIIVLIFKLSNVFISYIEDVKKSMLQADSVFDSSYNILKQIKKLPISFFEGTDASYLNSRLNSDINTIINTYITLFIDLPINLIGLLVILTYLFLIDIRIFIMLLASLPLYLFVYLFLEKKVYSKGMLFKEQQNIFFSIINRQLSSIEFIKINSIFDNLDNDLKKGYIPFREATFKYIKTSSILMSLFTSIDSILSTIFLIYGVFSISRGYLTIGRFMIIQSYITMSISIISSLASFVKRYPDYKVSAKRINDIETICTEKNGITKIKSIDKIDVENLSLKGIINHFSYTFEKGNLYIIKGGNGKGKSTLIKTILGLYIDEYIGSISYNNIEIKNLDLYYIRNKLISYIDQQYMVLYDDVIRNLKIKDDFDEKNANFILKLLNFNIKTCFANYLSGGEKQKIAITRAFSTSVSGAIFADEPTASLDKESKKIFMELAKERSKNNIVIIVTHDPELINLENSIIVEL